MTPDDFVRSITPGMKQPDGENHKQLFSNAVFLIMIVLDWIVDSPGRNIMTYSILLHLQVLALISSGNLIQRYYQHYLCFYCRVCLVCDNGSLFCTYKYKYTKNHPSV